MKLLIDMNLPPDWVEILQLRTQDVMPQTLGRRMLQILGEYEQVLEKGALVTVDKAKSRVHILPFS